MPLSALAAQFPTTQARFFRLFGSGVLGLLPRRHLGRTPSCPGQVLQGRRLPTTRRSRRLKTDVAGFEAAWLKSIKARTPSPFGSATGARRAGAVRLSGAAATPGRPRQDGRGDAGKRAGPRSIRAEAPLASAAWRLGAAVVVIGVGVDGARSWPAGPGGWSPARSTRPRRRRPDRRRPGSSTPHRRAGSRR